jgi:hypothetical protein
VHFESPTDSKLTESQFDADYQHPIANLDSGSAEHGAASRMAVTQQDDQQHNHEAADHGTCQATQPDNARPPAGNIVESLKHAAGRLYLDNESHVYGLEFEEGANDDLTEECGDQPQGTDTDTKATRDLAMQRFGFVKKSVMQPNEYGVPKSLGIDDEV